MIKFTQKKIHENFKIDFISPEKSLKDELFDLEALIKEKFLIDEEEEKLRKYIDKRRGIISKLEIFNISINKLYPNQNEDAKLATEELRLYIDFWCSRILEDKQHLLNLENLNYCQYYLDHKIPKSWDWERDFFIFINPKSEIILEAAVNRGLKNIIVIGEIDISENILVNLKQIDAINDFKLLFDKIQKQPGIINRFQIANLSNNEQSNLLENKINRFLKNASQVKNFNFSIATSFSEIWLKNFFSNIHFLYKNNFLNNLNFKNAKSAVVVGAGPSLSKNLSYLKSIQKKILIVTCLHALPALEKHKIIPDIVVHLDPEDKKEFVKLTKPKHNNPVLNLVLDTRVNNEFFSYPATNVFTFPFSFYLEPIANLLNINHPKLYGSNVIEYCISICENLNIKNITMIGNDLSFPDNKIYIKEALCKKIEEEELLKKKTTVEGYNGQTLQTSSTFSYYIDQLSALKKNLENNDSEINLFNSTEGGAKIPEIRNISLKNFFLKYESQQQKEMFLKPFSKFKKDKIKEQTHEFVLKTLNNFEKLSKIVSSLKKISKNNLESINRANYKKYKNKEIELNKFIESNWIIKSSLESLLNEFYFYNRKNFEVIKKYDFYSKMLTNISEFKKIISKNLKLNFNK